MSLNIPSAAPSSSGKIPNVYIPGVGLVSGNLAPSLVQKYGRSVINIQGEHLVNPNSYAVYCGMNPNFQQKHAFHHAVDEFERRNQPEYYIGADLYGECSSVNTAQEAMMMWNKNAMQAGPLIERLLQHRSLTNPQ